MELKELMEIGMIIGGFSIAFFNVVKNAEKGRVIESIIKGVESGVATLTDTQAASVKNAIRLHSKFNGIADELDSLVQTLTKKGIKNE